MIDAGFGLVRAFWVKSNEQQVNEIIRADTCTTS